MTEKVSIAMAVYNGEQFILDQLESFAKQTRKPDELIICDDRSDDNTVKIINEFVKLAPFKVLVFENSNNLGHAQNFNKALSLCTGDYVFLSDQDDVWYPQKIERMLSAFVKRPNIYLLAHDIEFCLEDLTPIGQTKMQRMKSIGDLQKDYVVGMATGIKRSFLEICLPVPKQGNEAHDDWLHKCAISVKGKVLIHDVLALHRRHFKNQTAEKLINSKNKLNLMQYCFKEISNILYGKSKLTPLNDNLLRWLKEKQNLLILRKIARKEEIEEKIFEEKNKIFAMNERININSMAHFKKPFHVYKLYKSGGYKYFKGWKSIIRDLLFC